MLSLIVLALRVHFDNNCNEENKMLVREFSEKHGLNEALGLDSEQKVELGYFEHIIRRGDWEFKVVTLSKDFSLFLSSLSDENRFKLLEALADEFVSNDDALHLVHKNKHLLVTKYPSVGKVTLHISQRA